MKAYLCFIYSNFYPPKKENSNFDWQISVYPKDYDL